MSEVVKRTTDSEFGEVSKLVEKYGPRLTEISDSVTSNSATAFVVEHLINHYARADGGTRYASYYYSTYVMCSVYVRHSVFSNLYW